MSALTIAYMTCRKQPHMRWFFESLALQVPPEQNVNVLKVDFHAEKKFEQQYRLDNGSCITLQITPPKPCVWQGAHRLTQRDYFAAANARNTAICYAPDGWIAFVDDLSVLMPGWLNAVREAMAKNYIVCGAFRKVNKLVVDAGAVKSFEDHAPGHDSRWKHGDDTKAVPCPPNWLFGCSFAAPVNALLKVNGLFEDCDSGGLGMEDCSLGMALVETGHKLRYDRRMFTLEAEELHHVDVPMLRKDKDRGKVIEIAPGVTHPAEKGHALVKRFTGLKWFPNDFGPFPDLAALRQHILAGGNFPVVNRPTVDWYDGQPLSEM